MINPLQQITGKVFTPVMNVVTMRFVKVYLINGINFDNIPPKPFLPK
jgi:hypothetical protein